MNITILSEFSNFSCLSHFTVIYFIFRVLIAYENGLIVLWDITEDRAVLVRGSKDFQLKNGIVAGSSSCEGHEHFDNLSDNEEDDKEISSLCWVSTDGSVLAVGYVDGDILLWNLSVPDTSKGQKAQMLSNNVVKVQLSSEDRRLPIIVLHWSPAKARNGCGGQLFVYGGEEIGSEEVLTVCFILIAQAFMIHSS